MKNDKQCFVISPIGEADSETRRRSDQVLNYVIKPAVSECGYVATRADEIEKPGIITSQVIERTVDDPLVVADLTEWNPNVFYELAIRHALRKPLVQLMQKGEQIPFDVATTRTIFLDHQDLDSVAEAKGQITAQVRELEADPSGLETPISRSLEIQGLRESTRPEDRSLADLADSVSSLRAGNEEDFRSLQRHIDSAIERIGISFHGSRGLPPRHRRQEATHFGMELAELGAPPALEVLLVTSGFRDGLPWIYELGREIARAIWAGHSQRARLRLKELRLLTEMSMEGPWAHSSSKSAEREKFLLRELHYRLDRLEESMPTRKGRNPSID